MSSDLSSLLDWATENGWSVSRTNKGHLRFEKPGRKIIFGSGTPSDWRSVKNIKMKLVREDRVSQTDQPASSNGRPSPR